MKIERDKWYLTREGRKVRVICTDAPAPLSIVVVSEEGVPSRRHSNGNFRAHFDASTDDLVGEYKEPVVVYMNQYEGSGWGYPHLSEKAAQEAVGIGRPAAVRKAVKFVEAT